LHNIAPLMEEHILGCISRIDVELERVRDRVYIY
jgi:hypothetical protein